jgi:hypothetical protein
MATRVNLKASGEPLVSRFNEEGSAGTGRTVEECKEGAERTAMAPAEGVYPAQFLELIHQRPEVGLSFTTQVSVGSDL